MGISAGIPPWSLPGARLLTASRRTVLIGCCSPFLVGPRGGGLACCGGGRRGGAPSALANGRTRRRRCDRTAPKGRTAAWNVVVFPGLHCRHACPPQGTRLRRFPGILGFRALRHETPNGWVCLRCRPQDVVATQGPHAIPGRERCQQECDADLSECAAAATSEPRPDRCEAAVAGETEGAGAQACAKGEKGAKKACPCSSFSRALRGPRSGLLVPPTRLAVTRLGLPGFSRDCTIREH